MERATLTIEEAAKMLGIGRQSAYAAAREGYLPVIRIGRRLLVPRAGIDRMLEDYGADRTAGNLPALR